MTLGQKLRETPDWSEEVCEAVCLCLEAAETLVGDERHPRVVVHDLAPGSSERLLGSLTALRDALQPKRWTQEELDALKAQAADRAERFGWNESSPPPPEGATAP